MTSKHKLGFTIIESMLFLAISGLVFVVGFVGIGARLEAVRYTDAVRNLESDVETVFRNTDDGLNLRAPDQPCKVSGTSVEFNGTSTQPGQEPQCAVAGVDVTFSEATEFKTSSVAVATGEVNGGDFSFFNPLQINDPDFDINSYLVNAKQIANTGNIYDLLWGLEYQGYLNSSNVTAEDIVVRYIRSPISTQTFMYAQVGSGVESYSELTDPLHVCFADQEGRSATLTFLTNATISVAYQGGACDI